MENAFSRLLKVLALERKQGYRNKAVIGGLDKFASRWEVDARAAGGNQTLVAEMVALLIGYPSVEDAAARERIIDLIIKRLREAEGSAGGVSVTNSGEGESAGERPARGGRLEPSESANRPGRPPATPRLTRPAPPTSVRQQHELSEGDLPGATRPDEATARSAPARSREEPEGKAPLPEAGGAARSEAAGRDTAGHEAAPAPARPVLPRPDRPGSQLRHSQPPAPPAGPSKGEGSGRGKVEFGRHAHPGHRHGGPTPATTTSPSTTGQRMQGGQPDAWGAAGPLDEPEQVPEGRMPSSKPVQDRGQASEALEPGAGAAPAGEPSDLLALPESDNLPAQPAPAGDEPDLFPPLATASASPGYAPFEWQAEPEDEEDLHFASEAQGERRRRSNVPRSQPHERVEAQSARGLDAPVTRLPSIGPSLAEKLAKLGVDTVRDLLYLMPRRYDDYSKMRTIDSLRYGEDVTIIGTVWQLDSRPLAENRRMTSAVVGDGTGEIQMTWFNPFVERQLHTGRPYLFSGKIDSYRGQLQIRSPEFEALDSLQIHTGRLVPIYPLTAGISGRWLRRLMKNTIDAWVGSVPDFLPLDIQRELDLLPLGTALAQIHFPENNNLLAAARRRLSFDEFFVLQLGVLGTRQRFHCLPARSLQVSDELLLPFLTNLPFAMTAAQSRVLGEIAGDLAGAQPMSRLLQGDVGSGKTAVAAAALWLAVANGAQGAIMAPTEILAEQHARSFEKLFAGLARPGSDQALRVALFTGRQRKAEREVGLAALAAGEIDIAVGTHALIQEEVTFKDLAVAVVDEQHRFGVEQRAALRQKGSPPHMLVMSATPIPRSLALTVFGDLDVSVIDEMPAGRTPIKTKWLASSQRERAYSFIRRQVEAGRQAFIIYPLVEESDGGEAKAAVEEHERLQKHIFSDLRLGLLHGRLKSDEKDEVMRAFAGGEIHILVATSVVEVGIDVPNASVILIEGAERFGLAQLHQFRGRVGRGQYPSYCILISDAGEGDSAQRLQALETSTDGFALAQTDLEMRGPGDFLGTRQSGLPPLQMAQLSDLRTLEEARTAAQKLFAVDPQLSQPEHRALAERVALFWRGAGDVS